MTNWNVVDFAEQFIPDRAQFFEKDMKICLRTYHLKPFRGGHAYFPALQCCCSTLDFLSQLHSGKYDFEAKGTSQLKQFVDEFMDSTVYSHNETPAKPLALST